MSAHPLDVVFRPRSVAVVGASTDPTKRGHHAVRALREGGFDGAVYPVNPRGGTLFGLTVHPDLDDLPRVPDLVLVCTPAETVPGIVERCGERGVGAAVVLAVGFAESDPEGEALERRLRDAARRTGIRVVGPNTSGVLNPHAHLNLIGVREVTPGELGILVQSGNVALSLMVEMGERDGVGVSVCVGVGNEAGVGFHEYLEWMGRDRHTRGVVSYAEGIRDPRRFLDTAAAVSRETPVALLKGGRSDRGRKAARSHTGAVGGAYGPMRAGLRQAGVVEVERTDELLPVARTLAAQPPSPPGRGVAILSDGGGQGTMAADALSAAGCSLADPGPETRSALRRLLGRAAAVANPVDLAGAADADPGVFARALRLLLDDGGVGALLVVGLFGGYHLRFAGELEDGEARAASEMASAAADAGVGLVVHTMYARRASRPLRILGRAGVPVEGSLDVACRCVSALVERGRHLSREPWAADDWDRLGGGSGEGGEAGSVARAIVERCRSEGRSALTEPEARRLVEAFGVRVVPATLCRGEGEVRSAVESLGGPAALKVVSAGIPHKTEAGGVAVGVDGSDAAAEAYRRIVDGARAHLRERGGGEPDGVLVSPTLDRPLAELLVGVRRDSGLGPVVTVGAGGIAVEVLGDAAHRVLPVGRDEAGEMLGELRIAPLLRGVRGRPAVDRESVVETLLSLARCLHAVPELEELEVNPLFAEADGAVAVDVSAYLREGDDPGGGPAAG